MEYFWEIFWLVVFVAGGAGIAVLISWAWWIGALIGLAVYLILLFLVKAGGPDGVLAIIDI